MAAPAVRNAASPTATSWRSRTRCALFDPPWSFLPPAVARRSVPYTCHEGGQVCPSVTTSRWYLFLRNRWSETFSCVPPAGFEPATPSLGGSVCPIAYLASELRECIGQPTLGLSACPLCAQRIDRSGQWWHRSSVRQARRLIQHWARGWRLARWRLRHGPRRAAYRPDRATPAARGLAQLPSCGCSLGDVEAELGGSVVHRREELAEDLVADGNRLAAADPVLGREVRDGFAEALG